MAQLNAILADGFDRDAFERALANSSALAETVERFGRLLPHPRALVGDLFAALYKLNAVLVPAREVAASALINHALVESVLASGGLDALRTRTALDDTHATMATVVLARRILEAMRREFRTEPEALVGAAEAAGNEEVLDTLREQLEHLEDSDELSGATDDDLVGALESEIDAMQRRLRRDRRRQREAAKIAARVEGAAEAGVERAREQVEDPDRHVRGLGVGTGGAVDADRRLELGERIMRSDKLRRLARLVGAMREVAFETRRRRAPRSPQEMHSVTVGDDLSRLLPSELVGLGSASAVGARRAMRVDFLRRYAERQLLQYRLHAPASRGPMVVCLDGSGSMQGPKELWGKAVALTLMEIARRERRRCLALVFSSGAPPFEVELLSGTGRGTRARVRDEDVMRFAEHFPGGGTDFEPPLTRAIDAVTEGNYRRGDVVFITDGQANASDALRQRIDAERKRHRFKIRAILVDVADHARGSVEAFADDVRMVSDLASDSIAEVFAAV